ncbi:MAG: choice-of-anchor B family protein [Bacteroidetes bacterium]|nr:MAG: choice-of-anchor B family protein [Bacteroidota bacterium]
MKNTGVLVLALLSCALFSPAMRAQDAQNVSLFANVKLADVRYSGSWSYVAGDGTEYALLGAKSGTAVFPIDDPTNVTLSGFVPGPVTNWREITVIGDHAYVVTDATGVGHAMQVIDLGFLPDSVHLVTSYDATFTKGHIIQKDIHSEAPYVYVCGTSTTQGVHIMDVSDPANPVEVGVYQPGYYIHDCHVRGDRLFAAAFYEGKMDIVDISDKSNPVLLSSLVYGGSNTHSSSLTEDGKYLIIADEKDGNPARIWNIEDLSNPFEVAQYTGNPQSLVHNPYVRGDFAFISHNTEGLRVLDIADPTLPVEVGFYDTYDGPSGGFSGLWSACPYFPSGKIIGGDRTKGLFVWTFNNTRAGRLYATAVDTFSRQIIFNPEVTLLETGELLSPNLDGLFKFGKTAGNFTLLVNAAGYVPKSFPVTLHEGDSITVELELVPENIESQISGFVLDSATLLPLKNAQFEIAETGATFSSDAQGFFSQSHPAGTYTLTVSRDSFMSQTHPLFLLPQDTLWLEIRLAPDIANALFTPTPPLPEIRAFPNPAAGFVTLDLTGFPAAQSIELYDPTGHLVWEIPHLTSLSPLMPRPPGGQGLYYFLIKNKWKENIGGGKVVFKK